MSGCRRRTVWVRRVVVGLAVSLAVTLGAQVAFAVWASLHGGGYYHFYGHGFTRTRLLWPDVGEVERPTQWHQARFPEDRVYPQWYVYELKPDHPLAYMRYAGAVSSALFGHYDMPESTETVYYGPDFDYPKPGSVVGRPPGWLGLWETPEGLWAIQNTDGEVAHLGIGWPMVAFVCRRLPHPNGWAGSSDSYDFLRRVHTCFPDEHLPYHMGRQLPNRVYWPGLAVNTLVWLPVVLLVYASLFGSVVLVRRGRRWLRLKRGVCWRCRYSLVGIVGGAEGWGVCPECGVRVRALGDDFVAWRMPSWRVLMCWGLPGVLGSLAGVVSVVVLMVVFVYVFLFLYMWLGIPGANPF